MSPQAQRLIRSASGSVDDVALRTAVVEDRDNQPGSVR
jgi:hypothetical protein